MWKKKATHWTHLQSLFWAGRKIPKKLHQQLITGLSRAFPFLPKMPGTVDRPSEVLASREHQVGSTGKSVIVPSTCPVVSLPVTRSPILTVRYLLIFVAVIINYIGKDTLLLQA